MRGARRRAGAARTRVPSLHRAANCWLLSSDIVSVGLQRLLLTGEAPLSLGIFPLRIRSPFSAFKGETRLACPPFSPTRSGIAVRFRGMD